MFGDYDFDVIPPLGFLFLDGIASTLTLTGLSALSGLISAPCIDTH